MLLKADDDLQIQLMSNRQNFWNKIYIGNDDDVRNYYDNRFVYKYGFGNEDKLLHFHNEVL